MYYWTPIGSLTYNINYFAPIYFTNNNMIFSFRMLVTLLLQKLMLLMKYFVCGRVWEYFRWVRISIILFTFANSLP